MGYLQQFYSEREVPDDQRLTIDVNLPYLTLRCQGTAELADLDAETQRRKLSEYQAEMRNFTEYLIATYHLQEQISRPNKKPGVSAHSIGKKTRKRLSLPAQ